MEIRGLYDLARQENIEVFDFSLPKTGSMSHMSETGRCYIAMDAAVKDGAVRERVHLSHELGHCITGSFYSLHTAVDCRQRHENRANKWAVQTLIPVEALDDAIAEGCITKNSTEANSLVSEHRYKPMLFFVLYVVYLR